MTAMSGVLQLPETAEKLSLCLLLTGVDAASSVLVSDMGSSDLVSVDCDAELSIEPVVNAAVYFSLSADILVTLQLLSAVLLIAVAADLFKGSTAAWLCA